MSLESTEKRNTTTRQTIIQYLEDVSNYHKETLIGLFVNRLQSKTDTELTINFNSYVATLVTVYKLIKPNLDKNNEIDKQIIVVIDTYLTSVMKTNREVTMDDIVNIFQIFSLIEDEIRKVCIRLGYTAENYD